MGEGRADGGADPGAANAASGAPVTAPAGGFEAPPAYTYTIPTTPSTPAPAAPSLFDSAPVEFKDKPWFQDLAKTENPQEAIWKQLAGAQELLGRKSTGIEKPGPDATPEQVKEFHKALGVPEAVDKYTYTPPDLTKLPEPLQKAWEANLNPEFTKGMQAKAFELGITQSQFDGLAAAFDATQLANIEANLKSAENFGAEQRKKFETAYGNRAPEVERIAKETAQKVIPKNIAETGDLNIALHEAMMYIYEHNFKNGSIANTAQSTAAPQDPANMQAAIMAERARVNPATGKAIYSNPFDPGYQAMQMRVDEMYKQLSKAQRGEQ